MSEVRVLVGDLFQSEAQTLTNTVNTVGVMGKGIAREFKLRFPDMYKDYVRRCESGTVMLGQPYLYKTLVPPWVLNFPTKDHWRSMSRIDVIQSGLDYLVNHYEEWGIKSLAVPPLGCGEGGLEWRVVGPTLYRGLARLTIPVDLYAPFGTPQEELQYDFLDNPVNTNAQLRLSPASIALAMIVDRIASQSHHYPIGRVGLQKITYFATKAGIPTHLEFERRPYGPFAEGLKKLLSRLVNNGVIEESRRGRMMEVKPGPTLHDARNAYANQLAAWEEAIERVADLFLRIPSTRRAEIAASVHHVAAELTTRNRVRGTGSVSEEEVIDRVLRWKERRRPPTSPDEIRLAVRTLAYLGWIDVEPPAIESNAVTV